MFRKSGEPGELRAAIGRYRTAFAAVGLLSALLNILLLGGSIYMMLIYDSVLPSHSLPTLIGLLVMLVGVYAFQGMFDQMRTHTLNDIANGFDLQLSRRVQEAMTDAALSGNRVGADGLAPMRDLANIRAFLSGSGPATLIDLPWILFFVGTLFLLHFWIGVTALAGSIALFSLTLVTEHVVRKPTTQLAPIAGNRNALAETQIRHSEMLASMGMRTRLLDRWDAVNRQHLAAHHALSRTVASLGGVSKIGRMLLQSLILTVGAWLVIEGKATGGVIFASSLLSARALAPVDQAIANWRGFGAAREGWRRLDALLATVPARKPHQIALPAPQQSLSVNQLYLAPPGTERITLNDINLHLEAGDGLAVIGPSAAGKSSLGRALLGIWRPLRGAVRMDGAALDQWDMDVLGENMGYLPQTVELLEGTISDNIARFSSEVSSEHVIAAARAAGVHEMIVQLPQGYDTRVGPGGGGLSMGQQQRIGLARALYRDPFLVVLDEPNSNLDPDGDAALQNAIASVRARKGIVVVIAHRHSALANANKVLMLRDGRVAAFGPRDEVLAQLQGRPVAVPSTPGGTPGTPSPAPRAA
ncbi:type I secretion system permease/ATPase [Sphingobium amiense]|uniref:Type I secretion system permease/ATPase n=1 Tax=Sphingobium amiense TaxID=135719 RepID=A0A494W993_9SPHN|nr:type I secretion system permease/ATPase [Sphingobium amiense]BBD99738.1 type I secretion system permease/ATPase [Sphingobium amiense]